MALRIRMVTRSHGDRQLQSKSRQSKLAVCSMQGSKSSSARAAVALRLRIHANGRRKCALPLVRSYCVV